MGQNVSSKYNWTYCVHLEVKSTYEYYCEFKGILCIVPEYVNTRILYSIENDYTNDQSFEILRKHLMHYKIYIYIYIYIYIIWDVKCVSNRHRSLQETNKFIMSLEKRNSNNAGLTYKFRGATDKTIRVDTLHWRHNDHDGVSNHQPHGCLLNRLFRPRSRKISKFRVTGLCVGNSPGPVNSPHKGPVTRKMFPFDDVIMYIITSQ